MISVSALLFRRILIAIGMFALALATQPSAARDMGGYVGGNIGMTTVDLCDDLNALGATSCDDEDTGFKIFGGYKFNANLAVEGGYVDVGEISASAGAATATADADALFVSAVGILPLANQFSIFGKAGVFFWDGTIDAGGAGSFSDDGTDLTIGAGVSYDFTDQFAIRGEWDRYDLDGDDVDMLSVGVHYMF